MNFETITYENVKVYVGEDFNHIEKYLPQKTAKSIFFITDENVYKHWQTLFEGLNGIVLPAGEEQKSLLVIENLINQLIEKGADRNSFLLGVGGGVICDITGFVASVFMRGIPFAFAPTTLLAQVDASIGGKNGVNTALYKNMIGVFNQPEFILIDPKFLKTLTDDIFKDGLAEVVKHACIKSKSYFEFLENHLNQILGREEAIVKELVLLSVKIKTDVVRADPYEKGERKLLNYGHTFGHAVEKLAGISHGKAVSIGIEIVNELAVKNHFLAQSEAKRITFLLQKIGLPTENTIDLQNLLPLVLKDKKKSGNHLSLILLEEIGKSQIVNVEINAQNFIFPTKSKTIFTGKYTGEIHAPASKSYLQRAIAIAALAQKPVEIKGYSPSNDAKAAISAAVSLGAKCDLVGNSLFVSPILANDLPITLNCGEAGLSARMFSPIAAIFERKTLIIGEGSLTKRPLDMVEDALLQLGKNCKTTNGKLPIEMQGKITAGTLYIDGAESSQLLTGLLIALPILEGDSVIHVKNLKSIPYIEMTLEILAQFGILITHQNFEIFYVKGNQIPSAESYEIEGDWSGAAFHLVGAAISGNALIKGLKPDSKQADSAILDVLRACGAKVEWRENGIYIAKDRLKSFVFDATHCPDLFPPLAVLAACCEGESTIIGTNRLTNKESNRALTIKSEFEKLGIAVILGENDMKISGGLVQGGKMSSQNDHRIAMAGAILALVAQNPIEITYPEAVDKSYPNFYEDIQLVTLLNYGL